MTFSKLLQREKEGRPIKVSIVGAGMMGIGVANQIFRMRGIKVAMITDIVIEKALKGYAANGIPREKVHISNRLFEIQDALRDGKFVVSEDGGMAAQVDVDVVVEATGRPEVGAEIAYRSILGRKHVVMLLC